jgi:hypothetical protein
MLTAFYVDNGKNLPFWREFPQIAFWLLPAGIGIPILLRSLLTHPLARRERLAISGAQPPQVMLGVGHLYSSRAIGGHGGSTQQAD